MGFFILQAHTAQQLNCYTPCVFEKLQGFFLIRGWRLSLKEPFHRGSAKWNVFCLSCHKAFLWGSSAIVVSLWVSSAPCLRRIPKTLGPWSSVYVYEKLHNTLVTWCQELTRWKRPWCWERLRAGGEGGDRDGWMASPTQWTRIWANFRRWWRTGRSGVLQSMGSQAVRHYLAPEQ